MHNIQMLSYIKFLALTPLAAADWRKYCDEPTVLDLEKITLTMQSLMDKYPALVAKQVLSVKCVRVLTVTNYQEERVKIIYVGEKYL